MNALAAPPAPTLAPDTAKLVGLARKLGAEGRVEDALTIHEHLGRLSPHDPETQRALAVALGARGRTLEAIETLSHLQALLGGPAAIAAEIREHATAAIAKFNALA